MEFSETDHLTPDGKRKYRKIDRLEQRRRFGEMLDRTANDIISEDKPVPKNSDSKETHYWWEKE